MKKKAKKAAPKRGRGRPKERVADRIKKRLTARGAERRIISNAAKAGLSDTQIAGVLGVTERTLNRWKADEQFMSALKEGKEHADKAVEDSLFVRALGYSIKEVTREPVMVGKKKVRPVIQVTKVLEKHVPADVTAQIFWLKNRQPENWRDRREITGADGKPLLEGIEVTVINGS